MLIKLLKLPQRSIYFIQNSDPAVYFVNDDKAGGILINTCAFNESLLKKITHICPIKYIFLPSYHGEIDMSDWISNSNAELIAHEMEEKNIQHTINIKVTHKTKLTRTIDFVPMAGRTSGSCALYLKNLPGVLFLGPILSSASDQWPSLKAENDDESFETRMFGLLGLKDLKYDYVFADSFKQGATPFGPKASQAINQQIDQFFD